MAAAVLAVLAVAGFLAFLFDRHVTRHPTTAPPTRTAPSEPRVVSTIAPWRLGAPISRAVVVAGTAPGSEQLIIMGGKTTGGLLASGAFSLDVTSGALTQVGDLTTTLDGAAGAAIGGQVVVFGGTSSPSLLAPASAVVQGLPTTATTAPPPSGTPVPTTTTLGTLPQARAQGTAVTVGATTYLVGGNDAAAPTSTILATSDGQHFVAVASLPVPVASAAVTAFGGRLYVFGGVATTGADAGRPVTTIQVVNLKTHKVTDSWHLPEPLDAAAAVVLGHDILVAGGDTASPGVGTPTSTPAGGTATSTTGTPTSTTSSVSTVWSFDPATGATSTAGQLAVPVSHAGAAVLGTTAWLVGGETNGIPVSAVQSFVTAAPTTPGRGSST
jgi:hypothetical protein